MPEPVVSVVIPLYNARDVIRDTLESVFAQTYHGYEIVVIDDGSTDGSGDAIRAYGDRLRYIEQRNGGVAQARNRGIAASRGCYIALMDHDDLWEPEKLAKQVAVLEEQPAVGMVVTDVAHIDRAGRPMHQLGPAYQPQHEFARLFVQGFVPTPSATLIRKAILEAVGGFDEQFNSAGMDDHELWTRIAAVTTIAGIPEPLTFHRNRDIKPADIALGHRPLLIDRLMSRFRQDPQKRLYLHRQMALYLADQGKYLIKGGRHLEGRSALLQGLKLSLGEGKSLKAAWRCVSRLMRSV
ncbi:MAG: glycosyl transferase family 2 [Nitrospira sp.]|jgi:glycosyltransferase involved in cell wall biosynthesis|nr:glycosyl transferase family 2 [Nitrospira sp.]